MKKDLYLCIIFFFALLVSSYYLSTFKEISLGAEYRCIAEAIVRGDGFSDPFCSPAGSSERTAWMPPLLSYLQAGIYILFGLDSFSAFFMLFVIIHAALASSLFFLLRLANEVNSKYRHFCIPIFAGYIFMSQGPFLLSFHDIWLISASSIAIPYVLYMHFIKKAISVAPVIFLALTLPLISPILALSFVCIVAYLFLKEYFIYWKKHKTLSGLLTHKTRSVPKLLIITLAFITPVMLWGFRNYLAFDKFIPVKSNLWFDFYQANVYDEDGLITGFTFANFHPIKNKARLTEYQETGETQLMALHKKESLRYLKENPAEYFRKVSNRFYATFLFSKHPFDEDFKIDDIKLTEEDLHLLMENQIIAENQALNMQMSPATFHAKIRKMGINQDAPIVVKWQNAKKEYKAQYLSPLRTMESILISGIPFFAWVYSLLFFRKFGRRKELLIIISILYLSYFLPYAMISTHTRYQIPLSPLFTLMLYFAFISILRQLNPVLLKKKTLIHRGRQLATK